VTLIRLMIPRKDVDNAQSYAHKNPRLFTRVKMHWLMEGTTTVCIMSSHWLSLGIISIRGVARKVWAFKKFFFFSGAETLLATPLTSFMDKTRELFWPTWKTPSAVVANLFWAAAHLESKPWSKLWTEVGSWHSEKFWQHTGWPSLL
jgi:hypothetical protein